jgi:hypothetical protein
MANGLFAQATSPNGRFSDGKVFVGGVHQPHILEGFNANGRLYPVSLSELMVDISAEFAILQKLITRESSALDTPLATSYIYMGLMSAINRSKQVYVFDPAVGDYTNIDGTVFPQLVAASDKFLVSTPAFSIWYSDAYPTQSLGPMLAGEDVAVLGQHRPWAPPGHPCEVWAAEIILTQPNKGYRYYTLRYTAFGDHTSGSGDTMYYVLRTEQVDSENTVIFAAEQVVTYWSYRYIAANFFAFN